MNQLEEYEYLWNGSSESWTLVHVNSDELDAEPEYSIIDTNGFFALIIEEDDIHQKVIKKMIERNVKILRVDEIGR